MLLLLLRGYLALRRSLLLRGGLRLCLLHHAALLAKSSGGVASAPTRIVGTAFRLLQRNEKNSFRINETCTPRRLARRRRGARRRAHSLHRALQARRDDAMHDHRAIAKAPVKWALLRCAKDRVRSCAKALDSVFIRAGATKNRRLEHSRRHEKKVAQISRRGVVATVARAGIARIVSTDSQNRLSISLRKPLDKVADMVFAAPIHVPRGIARPDFWRTGDVAVHREARAATPRGDQMPTIRCRAWP